MNNKFFEQYLKIICQQNGQLDFSKILTMQEYNKIVSINYQIAKKRTSVNTDTSYFLELSQKKPVILLNQLEAQYKYFNKGQFHGVPIDSKPWIPIISLFLQANSRTYLDKVMTKDGLQDKKNVFPIIYAPSFVTDQYETVGANKVSHENLDGYSMPQWMPNKNERTRAVLILNYAYSLFQKIQILVNDNGNLISTSIRNFWSFKNTFTMNAYPAALKDSSKFERTLVNSYGRYGLLEEDGQSTDNQK